MQLPAQPGAYPVRLTVQDANGGVAQALFVILHDPNGRTELAPATVATFKRDELRTAQTQIIGLQRSGEATVPVASATQAGLQLSGVAIANDASAVSLDARLQTTAVNGETMATWSALSGSFDQASGLQAKWRPAGASGLEAVTLSVTNGQGQQSQVVVRLLIEQGVPKENWLDFVQVQDGRLVRQTFAAIPSPMAALLPVPGASGTTAAAVLASGNPGASGSPGASASPGASPSPSGSPSQTGSQAPYATTPPSGTASGSPSPSTSTSPTPSASFTPYNPLATPTPQATPTPTSSPS
jgi:hypothetical protein